MTRDFNWVVRVHSERGHEVTWQWRQEFGEGATFTTFEPDYIDVARFDTAEEAWRASLWISELTERPADWWYLGD